MALLEVRNLTMRFGGLTAVDDLSFDADAGRITSVIGPNGAGKTTVFNCLTGFYPATSGRMTVNDGKSQFHLERMPGYRIAREAGIARTFQNIRLFPQMTVLENLLVAQHTTLMRASAWSIAGLLGLASWKRAEAAAIDEARGWLEKVGLVDRADLTADSLPYGDQRRLEVARAMCSGPRLLCLDEPAAGLNPRESAGLNTLLTDIPRETGVGIVLIEHDMNVVMEISDHVIVLDYGCEIAAGPPQAVKDDPAVIRAYLGEPESLDEAG